MHLGLIGLLSLLVNKPGIATPLVLGLAAARRALNSSTTGSTSGDAISTKAGSPVTPSGSHVHKMGGGYHPTERLGIDEFLDLLGQWTGQRGKIGLGQEGLQLAHGIHIVRGAHRDARPLALMCGMP